MSCLMAVCLHLLVHLCNKLGQGIPAQDRSAVLTHVQGYKNCVLTPNVAELGRLAKGAGVQLEGPISTAWQEDAPEVRGHGLTVRIANKFT